jgi:hypothetical protein
MNECIMFKTTRSIRGRTCGSRGASDDGDVYLEEQLLAARSSLQQQQQQQQQQQ